MASSAVDDGAEEHSGSPFPRAERGPVRGGGFGVAEALAPGGRRQLADTELSVVRTSEPWNLGIDAIVVSVGSMLGELADATREVFPGAVWDRIRFEDITPERPGSLDLPRVSDSATPLRVAVLATAHENGLGRPSLSAIGTAAGAAVHLAADLGATVLGMPLLGAGALAFDPATVAQVIVPAAVAAFDDVRGTALRRIVFFDRTRGGEAALLAALNHAPTADTGAQPRDPDKIVSEPHDVGQDYSTDELAGGVCTDRVDPGVGIPLSHDRLGVTPYVSMVATVIADRTTSLPVSVGVFGEWGSGKSYFMGLLREQIDTLAGSGESYCREIVQIGFNAWHYADSNLWASLGDEIFRQLAGPGPGNAERRERIRAELGERLEQLREVRAATEQARAAAAALQSDVDRADADRRTRARDLVAALRQSRALGRMTERLWQRLGISDAVEQGNLLADELRGTLTEADALRRAPRHRWGRIVLAGSVVLLALGAVAALVVPPAAWQWLSVAAAAVTAAAGVALAVVRRAREGVRTLRELGDDLRTGLDQARREQITPEVRNQLDALRKAEAEQRVAEAQLDDVVARVGELGRQLTELTPGNHLYTFLAERARSDSYRGNLGLISTIRKDFEQLVELMRDWRAHGEDGGRRPIDRIVLYIDDLDRCSARQVVDVLQAVHLLLAMDLFVVVVGVDPRWLLSSLRSHYDSTLGGAVEGRAAPEDYLEKIIGIPIALPGLSRGHLHGMLRSILDDTGVSPRRATGTGAATSFTTGPPAAPAAAGQAVTGLDIETGSEVGEQRNPARRTAVPRPLTDPEIDLLAASDTLITTPRQAKRLFNLYRMVRATRDLSEASRFLGDGERPGEYQAVVVLLAVLTAQARLFDRLLDTPPDVARGVGGGLLHRGPAQRWAEFLDDVRPSADDRGRWHNGIVGTLTGSDSDNAARSWKRLHLGLTRLSEHVTFTELAPLRTWVPVIRRFSYLPLGHRDGLAE
ncbi:KAP family P-loop domain protein [Saccharomonospora xinjiangensis]|uniref:KAP family P-loop domain protein n=1 Tax=Saccharomonospora xinjiangensis XJ-54 TaxID=882086 RepID=I0UWQ3_9PSEU|nr:KAP family P-loop domain protein [Saccharomonospora xinjiangensis]EID52306.1 KAP family P-loop domain protein [Saccharomonospora xinjiangensis XJ-54]